MKINNLISFEIGTIHSIKKDKDYYAIFAVLGDIKQVICFLTKTQYDSIMKMKKGE